MPCPFLRYDKLDAHTPDYSLDSLTLKGSSCGISGPETQIATFTMSVFSCEATRRPARLRMLLRTRCRKRAHLQEICQVPTRFQMAVAQKTGTKMETRLVSGNMDQNLRNPCCLILSHTQSIFLRIFVSGFSAYTLQHVFGKPWTTGTSSIRMLSSRSTYLQNSAMFVCVNLSFHSLKRIWRGKISCDATHDCFIFLKMIPCSQKSALKPQVPQPCTRLHAHEVESMRNTTGTTETPTPASAGIRVT